MRADQDLLDEARPFCDVSTGEVVERIPEDLMQRLRAAKLAVGVGGKRSERTETTATWFVLLDDTIRKQVLTACRMARRKRRRGPRSADASPVGNSAGKAPADKTSSEAKSTIGRGLGAFRRSRRPTK